MRLFCDGHVADGGRAEHRKHARAGGGDGVSSELKVRSASGAAQPGGAPERLEVWRQAG